MRNLLNILSTNKIKYIIILFFLLLVYTGICAFSYASTVSSGISESVFRLHVIANSDSDEDQNLKFIVRDRLIEYMNEISSNVKNKQEAIKIVTEHEDKFYEIAVNTIKEYGYNYDVNINLGNFYFPTKQYGDISLPSGNYDALRVEIGDARGQNWWCVMFPPLCFVDISSGIVPDDSKQLMKENLSNEEFNVISENNHQMKFKFKILEFFENSEIFTAKK